MRLHFRFFQGQKADREPDHLMIAGDGEPYRIELKRHAAARRYTLRVRDTSRDIVLTNVPPAWVHHIRLSQVAAEARS